MFHGTFKKKRLLFGGLGINQQILDCMYAYDSHQMKVFQEEIRNNQYFCKIH